MTELDEQMRRRLRALAETEADAELSPAARHRIVQRALEQVHTPRIPWWALALAAAVLFAVVWTGSRREPHPVATAPEPRQTAPSVDLEPGPRSTPVAAERPACAEAEVPEAHERRWRGGRRTIDLAGRARFVLFRGARAELERAACRTTLTLSEGRVLVHAEDLSGGELVVRTPSGDVVVHGTVFDVRLAGAGAIAVSVAEGEVGVGSTRVAAGNAYVRDAAGERVRALGASEAHAMLSTLRHPAVPRSAPEPEETTPARVPRGEVVGGVPRVHEPDWSRREASD